MYAYCMYAWSQFFSNQIVNNKGLLIKKKDHIIFDHKFVNSCKIQYLSGSGKILVLVYKPTEENVPRQYS